MFKQKRTNLSSFLIALFILLVVPIIIAGLLILSQSVVQNQKQISVGVSNMGNT